MKKFVVFALIMILGAVLLGIGIDARKWTLVIPGICGLILSVIYGIIAAMLAVDDVENEDDDF